ncbi:immunoglobulin-like domain-containing protein [Micromonospora sp. NPDC047753]|uniref:immunoglobulin-like domain-containing protein n=1 Tax=Micromonospora sp. NPDC047753 TaxID=3154817 RepID=UPI0033F2094F
MTGRITRPAQGQADATATLTATVRKGAQEVTTREIPVVVKAEFDDAQAVDRDAFDLTVDGADGVRGNLDLAAKGEFGSTITWRSTTGLVTPTGVVSRPAFGRADVAATLTATITKGKASQKKSFPVTITAMPRSEEYERYFMGYFKGEGIADGEQIMFATSNGNTALDWTGLTGGRPSLISQLGDQGLRDPHIVRSPDGDTFYMIATDLNWYDQGGYAINDTQYIEVFESHDLVNWTPQRHVKVAPDNAGNAFAPESLWVEELGAYVVFWAQSLWNDPVNRTGQGNAQMWYATTRDFKTFSSPQVWQDPAPLSRIDTTAIRVGDHYYRVTKNEAGNQGSDIFSEKHTDFLDSNIANWTLVAPALGRTTWVANQGYEGPVIFKANPGDTACPGQFYLWGDRYTNGGGYQAACHENIEAPTWNAKTITMTNAGVVRPRHGTVIPLTVREWNDIRGIPNSDVTTTTEVAVEPYVSGAQTTTATVTVTAADGFETGGQVRISIGSWSKLAHLSDGAATVTLPTGLPAGARTVKAEYVGFDYLKASEGTASFEVPSGPAAVKVKAKATAASVVRGDTFTLSVTVGPAGGPKQHAPTPTGEVTVTFGGAVHVVPLAHGKAVVELQTADLRPGAYQVHVAYSGNPTYQPYAADYQKLTVPRRRSGRDLHAHAGRHHRRGPARRRRRLGTHRGSRRAGTGRHGQRAGRSDRTGRSHPGARAGGRPEHRRPGGHGADRGPAARAGHREARRRRAAAGAGRGLGHRAGHGRRAARPGGRGRPPPAGGRPPVRRQRTARHDAGRRRFDRRCAGRGQAGRDRARRHRARRQHADRLGAGRRRGGPRWPGRRRGDQGHGGRRHAGRGVGDPGPVRC